MYRNLLKRYNLNLGEEHFAQVEQFVQEFEVFFPKEEDGTEPARGMVFAYLVAALEEVFRSYGVQQYQDIRLTSLRFKRLGEEPQKKFGELVEKTFGELRSMLEQLKAKDNDKEPEDEIAVDTSVGEEYVEEKKEEAQEPEEEVLPQPTKLEMIESIIDANENGQDQDEDISPVKEEVPHVKKGPGRPKKNLEREPHIKRKPGRPKK